MFMRKAFKWLQRGEVLLSVMIMLFAGVILFVHSDTPQAKVPAVIRAQRFELVDEQGHILAELRFYKQIGAVSFSLFGKDGTFSVSTVEGGHTEMKLHNRKEKTAIYLGVPSGVLSNYPNIVLVGKKRRIGISFKSNGDPLIGSVGNKRGMKILRTPWKIRQIGTIAPITGSQPSSTPPIRP